MTCSRSTGMGKTKKAILMIGGLVGIITLQSVRMRRSKTVEEESKADAETDPDDEIKEVVHEEAETVTEHAEAAVAHASQAAQKSKQI